MKGERPKKLASNGATAVATSMAALLSVEQIKLLKNLSRKLEIDLDITSREMFDVRYAELSRSGGDDLIAHLEKMSGGLAVGAKILRFDNKRFETKAVEL